MGCYNSTYRGEIIPVKPIYFRPNTPFITIVTGPTLHFLVEFEMLHDWQVGVTTVDVTPSAMASGTVASVVSWRKIRKKKGRTTDGPIEVGVNG